MLFITSAFAQTTSTASASGPFSGGLMSLLPLILMFVVLYFIMIRPQMKKQKQTKNMLAALQNGDEIITTSGILGKIIRLSNTHIVIEIAPEVEVVMQRSAILAVMQKDGIKLSTPK